MPDPFEPVSSDSQKFLEQVKKGKPRNFALITKGVKIYALLVKKKRIKPAEVKELKKASKGTSTFVGVVGGKGQNITFKLSAEVTEKAPSKELILKDFLMSKAEFKCKPKYEIVQEQLDEIDDDEDVGVEEENVVEDPAIASFGKAIEELEPKVKDFVRVFMDRRVEILKPWKTVKDFFEGEGEGVKQQDADQALEKVRELLGDLDSVGPETTAPKKQEKLSPEVQKQMADFTQRLKDIKPDLDKVVAGNVAVSVDTKLRASEAAMAARKQEFEKAAGLLDEVIALVKTGLQQLNIPQAPPMPKETTSEASEFGWRTKELAPKVKQLVKDQLEGFQQIGKLFKDAQGLKASDPGKAVELLRECSRLLEEALKAAARSEEVIPEESGDLEKDWDERIKPFPIDMKLLREGGAADLVGVDLAAIQKLHDQARKSVDKGDFKNAFDLQNDVERLIAEARGKMRAGAAFDKIPKGSVQFLKALHEWEQAAFDIQEAVESVQRKIVEIAPEDENTVANQLDEILQDFGSDLDELLQQCIDAPDDVAQKRLHGQALTLINSFLKNAETHEKVQKIDTFPLEKVDVKKTLTSALNGISKQLGVGA